MIIIGKKTQNEIQSMREELLQKDKKDHAWFEKFKICMLIPCSAAWGGVIYLLIAATIATINNTEVQWVFADHWLYMLITVIAVFACLFVWLRKPYKFNDDSMELPKSYRYAWLTNDKNVLKEEVYIDNTKHGAYANLEVTTMNDNEEEYHYVGMFPVVLKRDISETIIDLEKEKAYVPYNYTDVTIELDDEEGDTET